MERLLIPIEKIKLIFHYKDRTVQRLKGKESILGYALLFTAVLIAFAVYELKTSRVQAYFFNNLAKDMKFWVEPDKSSSIRFPKEGPYDKRLGYVYLPAFVDRLTAKGYKIESQARISNNLAKITDRGIFTTFHEKTQAGLQIQDRDNNVIFAANYPERIYNDFNEVPDVMVKSLLFIENKELLNPQLPYLNPAVEWDRLAKAVMFKGRHLIDKDERVPGGSTLATQMEKYRHSPNGLTTSVRDKYIQMTSAALRAYLNGQQNIEARQRIVLDYINSMPLGAVPGYGQVNGMGDGLYAWYDVDFNYINKCLKSPGKNQVDTDLTEWARAYKQVLSLFLAQRRPSFYLLENHNALEAKSDGYIRVLAENGIISLRERDAALQARLTLRQYMPVQRKASFIERKAANTIRPMLLALLKVPSLYDQDLLDLTVKSSLDYRAQKEVTDILRKLSDPEFTKAAGLNGPHMLGSRNPANVIYSLTLYERTPGANLLRIQTDNFDQPFNINEGVKLELGSTAKLRTLITYLEIIAVLHNRYAGLSNEQLRAAYITGTDQLSKWAVDYLSKSDDKSLQSMLKAAMERQYSASPAEHFFTGGGEHTFSNYDNKYNHRVVSVSEGFQNSVNLVFIRIMRDIVRYYTYQRPDIAELFENVRDPRRQEYLERFADREGKIFINRFYNKYKGKSFEDAFGTLLQGIRPTPSRLAVIFRSVKPEAGIEEFTSFMRFRLQNSTLTENALLHLYENYAQGNYPLVDRGYIAHVHPLELWTVAFLRSHPGINRYKTIEASKNERQEVYTWLFKTHWKNAQDIRIRTLLEVEAFSEVHHAWKNLGYPFESLVPSYATAIGSSADRPGALAELVGIILNHGVLYQSQRIQELHFAKDTPYETIVKRQTEKGERVLLPEIANTIREAMTGVVEKGTAHSVHKAFTGPDGKAFVIGGKTGTGDNRHEVYGTGGRLIKSEAINRTAVFVFFIGDRFFGTITAYVAGNEADNYSFTSSLPVQVLKTLAPKLMPMIDRADTEDQVRIARNDAKRIM